MKKLFLISLLLLGLINYGYSQEKLNLKKAVRIALDNNKDLVTIKNNLEIQTLNLKLSRGSLLPNLTFSSGWNKTNSVSSGGTIYQNGFPIYVPGQNTTKDNWSSGLSSQVILFNGFANYENIDLNKQTIEQLNFQHEKLKNDIIINVTSKYFDLIKKSYLVKVYEDNLNNSREQLNKIKVYIEVGKKTISEMYKQDVQVAQDELTLERAYNEVQKANVDLLYSMYSDVNLAVEIDLNEIPYSYSLTELKTRMNKYGNVAGLSQTAINNRYDYKVVLQDIRINETRLSISNKNLFFPSLSAFSNYNITGNQLNDITNNRVLTVGLALNYTIFQGYSYDVNKQIAEINLKQKKQDLSKLELQIKSDLKKAVIDLQTAYKQTEILDRNIASAEQDVFLSSENYRIGYGTLLDYQTAVTKLNSLKVDKINSVYNFLLLEKQIDYLTGTINY
jgi:outer membrane protein TolC